MIPILVLGEPAIANLIIGQLQGSLKFFGLDPVYLATKDYESAQSVRSTLQVELEKRQQENGYIHLGSLGRSTPNTILGIYQEAEKYGWKVVSPAPALLQIVSDFRNLALHALKLDIPVHSRHSLDGARRILLPFARARGGKIQFFPTVDISLGTAKKSYLEVCPALKVDSEAIWRMQQWASSLSQAMEFVGVGSFEFSVDASNIGLLGGSCHLHPLFHLWEQVAGTSALVWQFATLFEGDFEIDPSLLNVNPPHRWNIGVGVRIFAEDSRMNLPQAGTIYEVSNKTHWKYFNSIALMQWNVFDHQTIDVDSSGLIGNLHVFSTMDNGVDPLKRPFVLAQSVMNDLWISGSLQTNEQFLKELLAHPWVREGIFHSNFLEEDFVPSTWPDPEYMDLFFSIICELENVSFNGKDCAQANIKWFVNRESIRLQERKVKAVSWVSHRTVFYQGDEVGLSGRIELRDGRIVKACAYPFGNQWMIRVGSWFILAQFYTPEDLSSGKMRAQLRGKVHRVHFQEGEYIAAHQPILHLIALGTSVPQSMGTAIELSRLKVKVGDVVNIGQDLAELRKVKEQSSFNGKAVYKDSRKI